MFQNFLIRLTPGNIPGSLKAVEKTWKDIVPEYPLDYTFVDQDYERLFRAQMRLTGIALGAIIIAMLTISFQAFKATGINPAEALKVE